MALSAICADAAPQLTGSPRIAAAVASGTGSTVSFELRLANTGTEPLSSIVLQTRSGLTAVDASSALSLPLLNVGESVSLTWAIPLSVPPEQLYPGNTFPLQIEATAVDSSGQTVTMDVAPEKEAL
jgi:hypothetical protein